MSSNVRKLRMSATAPGVSLLDRPYSCHVLPGLVLVDRFYVHDGSHVCKAPVCWSYAWVVCVWMSTVPAQPVCGIEAAMYCCSPNG